MKAVSAIILVGGPGNSHLRTMVGDPVCLLPVPGNTSLITAWLDVISGLDAISNTAILTGSAADCDLIARVVSVWKETHSSNVETLPDRNEHRGTAGTIADYTKNFPTNNDLLVIEGTTTPPENPRAIFDEAFLDDAVSGVLGSTENSEPAGMLLLKRDVINLIPEIGFFDLKEQLLPRVLERRGTVLVRQISKKTNRLSSMSSYLESNMDLGRRIDGTRPEGPWIHADADVHPEATLGVNVLVAGGATIDPGAILEDAVVLPGAHVCTEALVVRSIISAGKRVPPGVKIIRSEEYITEDRTKKGFLRQESKSKVESR